MSDMSPGQAVSELRKRSKRLAGNRGPQSLGFTLPERCAVRILAACAHSQATIATRAGISVATLKRAFKADEKLREAYDAGIAEERLKIDGALLKTALDSKNPRQVQAAMSLLKSRHGVTEGGGRSVSVEVNNVLALPSPQDARKYGHMIKRVINQKPPTVIEHKPDRETRVELDPVASVKERQRIERA